MLVSTKPPKCQVCKRRLEHAGKRLHDGCMDVWIARQLAKQGAARKKKAEAAKKVEREHTKARKEAIETIPRLIALADRAFADFIRERDRQAGHPCISSGRPLDWSGNQVDAGHYRSRGAASHLRYDERNCHAQSKHDNRHLAGNAVEYRMGLIDRIGLPAVESLEADNTPTKWTRELLRNTVATYRQKLRDLQKATQ